MTQSDSNGGGGGGGGGDNDDEETHDDDGGGKEDAAEVEWPHGHMRQCWNLDSRVDVLGKLSNHSP